MEVGPRGRCPKFVLMCSPVRTRFDVRKERDMFGVMNARQGFSGATVSAIVLGLVLGGCGAQDEANESDPEMADSIGRPLGAVTAEIARINSQTDRDYGLVARLEVQPNEVLEFYEPAPGIIVLSGA